MQCCHRSAAQAGARLWGPSCHRAPLSAQPLPPSCGAVPALQHGPTWVLPAVTHMCAQNVLHRGNNAIFLNYDWFPNFKKAVWQAGPPSKVSWKYEDVKRVLLAEVLSQDPAHCSVQCWLVLPGQDCAFLKCSQTHRAGSLTDPELRNLRLNSSLAGSSHTTQLIFKPILSSSFASGPELLCNVR